MPMTTAQLAETGKLADENTENTEKKISRPIPYHFALCVLCGKILVEFDRDYL